MIIYTHDRPNSTFASRFRTMGYPPKCVIDNSWNWNQCRKEDGFCLPPPDIPHSSHNWSSIGNISPLDTIISYQCNNGYESNGYTHAICIYSSERADWLGPSFTCEKRNFLSEVMAEPRLTASLLLVFLLLLVFISMWLKKMKVFPENPLPSGHREPLLHISESSSNGRASPPPVYDISSELHRVFELCGQKDALEMEDFFPKDAAVTRTILSASPHSYIVQQVNTSISSTSVIKVIPLEEDWEEQLVDLLPQIKISLALSDMPSGDSNTSNNYIRCFRINFVEDDHPEELQQLYEDFTKDNNSLLKLNLSGTDKFLLFEMEFGGNPLSEFKCENVDQASSFFQQMALSLAAAEQRMSFEHRALVPEHILFKPTTEEELYYHLNGSLLRIPSHGHIFKIIGFSSSRATDAEGAVYQDLDDICRFRKEDEELGFIYHLMSQVTKNDWSAYKPSSNLCWLRLVFKQMCDKHSLPAKWMYSICDELMMAMAPSVADYVSFCMSHKNKSQEDASPIPSAVQILPPVSTDPPTKSTLE